MSKAYSLDILLSPLDIAFFYQQIRFWKALTFTSLKNLSWIATQLVFGLRCNNSPLLLSPFRTLHAPSSPTLSYIATTNQMPTNKPPWKQTFHLLILWLHRFPSRPTRLHLTFLSLLKLTPFPSHHLSFHRKNMSSCLLCCHGLPLFPLYPPYLLRCLTQLLARLHTGNALKELSGLQTV